MRGRSHGDVGAMGAIKYTLHGHDRCFRASAKCSVERRSSIRNDLAGIAEDFALLFKSRYRIFGRGRLGRIEPIKFGETIDYC